jgi:hypothetical protein
MTARRKSRETKKMVETDASSRYFTRLPSRVDGHRSRTWRGVRIFNAQQPVCTLREQKKSERTKVRRVQWEYTRVRVWCVRIFFCSRSVNRLRNRRKKYPSVRRSRRAATNLPPTSKWIGSYAQMTSPRKDPHDSRFLCRWGFQHIST